LDEAGSFPNFQIRSELEMLPEIHIPNLVAFTGISIDVELIGSSIFSDLDHEISSNGPIYGIGTGRKEHNVLGRGHSMSIRVSTSAIQPIRLLYS